MRALATFSLALLTTATPVQATDVDDEGHLWEDLCSVVGLGELDPVEDVDPPCPFDACALPNESFPEVPDEVLPVEVNASQCLTVIMETVEELLPLVQQAHASGPGAGRSG